MLFLYKHEYAPLLSMLILRINRAQKLLKQLLNIFKQILKNI